jgi:hypothetical protein
MEKASDASGLRSNNVGRVGVGVLRHSAVDR